MISYAASAAERGRSRVASSRPSPR
jgi:hypothetical protein